MVHRVDPTFERETVWWSVRGPGGIPLLSSTLPRSVPDPPPPRVVLLLDTFSRKVTDVKTFLLNSGFGPSSSPIKDLYAALTDHTRWVPVSCSEPDAHS